MIEENPIACVDPVRFAVIDGVPVGGAFRRGVRRPGMKRRRLRLGRWRRAEHLRGPGLIVSDVGTPSGGDVGANGLEEAEGTGGDHIGGVVRDLERNGDV